jgi:hypothetical protein
MKNICESASIQNNKLIFFSLKTNYTLRSGTECCKQDYDVGLRKFFKLSLGYLKTSTQEKMRKNLFSKNGEIML